MNILYVSHLSTNISAGPNWSTPAGIKAQEKIDNCLWVELNDVEMPHWRNTKCYHNIKEYSKKLDLKTFPEPFNHPDLVVFEGFYDVREAMFAKKLVKLNIPYVIIPRGSLTHQSLNNNSKWKKKIAHWLIFNQYAYKADAIQYLTNDEYKDSGDRWNKQHIIIPNGFSTPERTKSIFNSDKIN